MFTLSNDTFTIKEESGKDENGDIIYKDVVYEQLIQINYYFKTYNDSINDISQKFRIVDSSGGFGTNNPSVKYSEIPVDGMESLVVALKNKSDKISIQIYYSGIITPNAIVKLTESDDENLIEPKIEDIENQIEEKDSVIRQYEEALEYKDKTQSNLYLIIFILGFCVIIELSVILFLLLKKKK